MKRNFLHVHFSDKLKPLRIGPFKIINKISDITYEIVNQDGYTSHIQRNHLVPYYPKEPIIFPFIQQYNPHSNVDDNDYNDSNTNEPMKPFNSFSNEEKDVILRVCIAVGLSKKVMKSFLVHFFDWWMGDLWGCQHKRGGTSYFYGFYETTSIKKINDNNKKTTAHDPHTFSTFHIFTKIEAAATKKTNAAAKKLRVFRMLFT